jgi:hypothetical protein
MSHPARDNARVKIYQMPCLGSLSLKKDRRSLKGDGIAEKGNAVDMKEDAKACPSPVFATSTTIPAVWPNYILMKASRDIEHVSVPSAFLLFCHDRNR